jgi:hypothetical protein
MRLLACAAAVAIGVFLYWRSGEAERKTKAAVISCVLRVANKARDNGQFDEALAASDGISFSNDLR